MAKSAGSATSAPVVCLSDFESYARTVLEKSIFDYFKGGADDEETIKSNVEAFKRLKLLPRVLHDVSSRDTSTSILGFPISFPVCIAPTAFHGLGHPDGEIASARGAVSMKTCYTMSFAADCSINEVSDATPGGLKFLQIYNCRNREIIVQIIRIAERRGFKAFVVTVDVPVLGNRRRDIRNKVVLSLISDRQRKDLSKSYANEDFEIDDTINWEYVRWIKSITKLPIIVKGILTAEDALLAVESGAAGILVSNHGGRQLDCVPATIDVLADVVKAVAGRCEVYLDGGVRKGTDVLKALALGAKAVFVGRPTVYALAFNGEDGVRLMLQILKREFTTAMALCGCSRIEDIKPSLVKHQSHFISNI